MQGIVCLTRTCSVRQLVPNHQDSLVMSWHVQLCAPSILIDTAGMQQDHEADSAGIHVALSGADAGDGCGHGRSSMGLS